MRVFADTFYFFALLNPNDQAHRTAVSYSETFAGELVTTRLVLVEFADGFSSTQNRLLASNLIRSIQIDPEFTIVPLSDGLFERGLDLFTNRADKNWSLTDCLSFCVMEELGITQALTGDRPFAQAGFVPLLKSDT